MVRTRALFRRSLFYDLANDFFGARCGGREYGNYSLASRCSDHTPNANFAKAIFKRLSHLLVIAGPDLRRSVLWIEIGRYIVGSVGAPQVLACGLLCNVYARPCWSLPDLFSVSEGRSLSKWRDQFVRDVKITFAHHNLVLRTRKCKTPHELIVVRYLITRNSCALERRQCSAKRTWIRTAPRQGKI